MDSPGFYLLNNAPIADNISITTSEDTDVNIELPASNPDGDKLAYYIDNQPEHGNLEVVKSSPNCIYTPEAGYTGFDSFTFHANDGSVNSNTAIVNLTISITIPGDPKWQESDMGFTLGKQGEIVVGNGRNDGVMRVYTGDNTGCAGKIYEFTWSGSAWQADDCGSFFAYSSIAAMYAGDGANDGADSIYIAGESPGIIELSYVDQSWEQMVISNSASL